jgi:hypothetical protein
MRMGEERRPVPLRLRAWLILMRRKEIEPITGEEVKIECGDHTCRESGYYDGPRS